MKKIIKPLLLLLLCAPALSFAHTDNHEADEEEAAAAYRNRYAIYNADPGYAVPQVFAARLPAGFLDSLG